MTGAATSLIYMAKNLIPEPLRDGWTDAILHDSERVPCGTLYRAENGIEMLVLDGRGRGDEAERIVVAVPGFGRYTFTVGRVQLIAYVTSIALEVGAPPLSDRDLATLCLASR